jgi:hypothetical protein
MYKTPFQPVWTCSFLAPAATWIGSQIAIQKEDLMKTKYAAAMCEIGMLLSAAAFLGAQDMRTIKFTGTISDYSPSTVAGGPYEIRGEWSLELQKSGTANFSAALNMQTSDYGISNATQVDPANPATRSPHTHHLSLTNGTVSYDTSVCPAYNPPATGAGIVVTGTVTTTGNGSPASFESKGSSALQVCIIGGSQAEYSNFSMVYTGPATGHFGPQAIHGVVRTVSAN